MSKISNCSISIQVKNPKNPCPVASSKTHQMIGRIRRKAVNAKRMTRKKPYCSRNCLSWYARSGKTANKIFDPSSGGIGTRLNMARTILAYEIIVRISLNPDGPITRAIAPKINAMRRFEIGPAAATNAGPQRKLLRLYGLNGTGFAYAKRNPPAVRT